MEAVGALRNVRKIWERGDSYVGTYVMDDDSTTCSVLSHPYKEMLCLGRILVDQVPNKIKKSPKSDNGQLWLDHLEILPLADKNHRGKNFAKKIFQLASAPAAISRHPTMTPKGSKETSTFGAGSTEMRPRKCLSGAQTQLLSTTSMTIVGATLLGVRSSTRTSQRRKN
jgi:hypothetical protein